MKKLTYAAAILGVAITAPVGAQIPERAELEKLVELQPNEALVQLKNGCYFVDSLLAGEKPQLTTTRIWTGQCLYGLVHPATSADFSKRTFYTKDIKSVYDYTVPITHAGLIIAGNPWGYTEGNQYYFGDGRKFVSTHGSFGTFDVHDKIYGFKPISPKPEMSLDDDQLVQMKQNSEYYDLSRSPRNRYFFVDFEVANCGESFTEKIDISRYLADKNAVKTYNKFFDDCKKWKAKPTREVYGTYFEYPKPKIARLLIDDKGEYTGVFQQTDMLCDNHRRSKCATLFNEYMAKIQPSLIKLGAQYQARVAAQMERAKRLEIKLTNARDATAKINNAKWEAESKERDAEHAAKMMEYKAKFAKLPVGELYASGLELMSDDEYDFAHEAFMALVRRFPDHPFAAKALEKIDEIDSFDNG